MRRTLLFDMDGTLVDSAQGVLHSLDHAMLCAGLPPLPPGEVRQFLGPPLDLALKERCGLRGDTLLTVHRCYMEHYETQGLFLTLPAPGMPELTASLRARGFRLAIATCKPWAWCAPTLSQCGFSACFDPIVGSFHNGVPEDKTAVIREALRLTGAPPEAAVMIGDRATDVRGARACGIPCIGVDFCGYADPGELESAGAAAVAHTAAALNAILLGT